MSRLLLAVMAALEFAACFSVKAETSGVWVNYGMTVARSGHAATLLLNGQVLVSDANYGTCELYTPSTGLWSTTGSMLNARREYTTTLLPNGKVLMTGGFNENWSDAYSPSTCELYDPVTGTWTATGSMANARFQHTATLLKNGLVLVTGGDGAKGDGDVTCELYDPEAGTWTATGSMAQTRSQHTATLLKSGKVLVAGGYNDTSCELYDPEAGTWVTTGSMAQASARQVAILLSNGKVLVTGEDIVSCELYDPEAETWTATGSITQARQHYTATLLPNGKVLMAGGYSGGMYFSTCELFDPETGTWATTGSMSQARSGHTATLLPTGKVLVAGGYYHSWISGGGALSSCELYDPSTETWSAPGVTQARSQHATALLSDGDVLAAGGGSASCDRYDAETGLWGTTGAMANSRSSHSATTLKDGQVLAAGGNDGSSDLTTCELYNPSTKTWSTTGTMSQARANHVATLLASGKVLVAGGGSATCELYDPTAKTWAATGAMSLSRSYHTATLLSDGKVLVTGGYDGSTYLDAAEIYDPASGTWTTTGTMTKARSGHTATLLSNGKVLVVGGNNPDALADCEIYDPSTGKWAATGAMTQARYDHAATLLPDGKAFVMGGRASAAFSSCELFDPATEKWATANAMTQARYYCRANLLNDGSVLVSGGYATAALSSAELYIPNAVTVNFIPGSSLMGGIGGVLSQIVIKGDSTEAVYAAPRTGYKFVKWTGTNGFVETTDNPLVVDDVQSSMAITANFGVATCSLAYAAGTNGTLDGQTAQTVNYGCSGTEVTAVADPGCHFVYWSDGVVDNPRTDMDVTEDISVIAYFFVDTFLLKYAAGSNGSLVGQNSQTVNYGSCGTAVTAVPISGYHFTAWSDGLTDNPRVDANVIAGLSVTANFEANAANAYTLSYVATATGTLDGKACQLVDKGGSGTSVEAVPAHGYYFVRWSDGSKVNPRRDANVAADVFVTAIFAAGETHRVDFVAGDGGSVSGETSQTIVDGESCSPVEAVPNVGHHFTGWDNGFGTVNPLTVTNVKDDMAITASFAIDTFTLTYAAGEHGRLKGEATQTVNYGASGLEVEAVSDTGYHFVSWSDGKTDNPRTDANVTTNISVTASFAINVYTVTFSATEGGSVDGQTTQSVEYGASCNAVEAVPEKGYAFAGWDNGFGVTNPLTVTNVVSNMDIVASFAKKEKPEYWVAQGSVFTVQATDMGKTSFAKTPKVQAVDLTTNKKGGKGKVLGFQKNAASAKCVWMGKEKPATYGLLVDDASLTKEFVIENPNAFDTDISPDTGKTGDRVTVTGQWFGTKCPKVVMEFTDAKGKLKKMTCKVLKPYKYADANNKSGKSVMYVDQEASESGYQPGDSELTFVVPKGITESTTAKLKLNCNGIEVERPFNATE